MVSADGSHLWFALLATLISVVVSLVMVEAGLRIYERLVLDEPDVPSAVGKAHRKSKFPGRIYELSPNEEMVREGVVIKMNSLGFRDDEPPSNAADRPSVLVLGDSVAWGWGVPMEKAFPQRLEQLLADDVAPVVYNSAVDGYTSLQQLATLKQFGPVLKPDLILVAYVLNDPSSAADGGLARHFQSEWAITRYSRIAWERIRELASTEPIPKQYHQRIHAIAKTEIPRTLKELRQASDEIEAKILLTVFPIFDFEEDSAYRWQNIHDDLKRWSNENGIQFVDLYPAFSENKSSNIAIDALHPNVEGHRIVAEYLREPVRALLPLR